VFGLLTYFGFGAFKHALDMFLPEGSVWADVANVIALVIFTPVLLIAVYFLASILANLIASPFNDLLSEQIVRSKEGSGKNRNSVLQVLAGIGSVLTSEIKKYLYFGLFYIPIVIITFIPPFNLFVAPAAWFIFGAWMLALEYLAFPIQNNRQTFAQVRSFARSNRMRAMGFGLAILLATLVPFVNFIVIPAGVAGATLLWLESKTGQTA